MKKAKTSKKVRDTLPEKSQKSHFYVKKNLKKSEGLKGNSGGSQKTLKKSLLCQKKSSHFYAQKNSKSHFYVTKNLKKSLLCQPDAKGGLQMRYLCNAAECRNLRMLQKISGWVADAVPLQHSCVSQNLNYKKHMKCLIEAMHVSCCVCDIFSL